MTTANEIKNLFRRVEITEMLADAADAAWEADPENEQAEYTWDAAYKQCGEAQQAFAEALEDFTAGAVDAKTARRMLVIKRDELAALIDRLAA